MSHSVELEEVRLDSETDCDTDREVRSQQEALMVPVVLNCGL